MQDRMNNQLMDEEKNTGELKKVQDDAATDTEPESAAPDRLQADMPGFTETGSGAPEGRETEASGSEVTESAAPEGPETEAPESEETESAAPEGPETETPGITGSEGTAAERSEQKPPAGQPDAEPGVGSEDSYEEEDDTDLRDTGRLSKIIRRADKAEKKDKRKERRVELPIRLHTTEENEADKQRFLKLPAHVLSYVIVIGGVLLAVFLVSFISGHWKYRGYHVINSRTQEATVSFSYCNVEGDILRYSTDGASLLDSSGEILWDVSYSMNSPDVAVRGTTIAIYDTAGSDIVICDRTGQIGSASAGYPIKKAEVSAGGNVAAIEENSSTTYIEYYSVSGTQIAEIKTSMDNPGYPLDLALSEDGQLIAVSYLAYDGGTQKNVIDVYSFGSAGQNQMDNRIGEFEYTDRIIPELVYVQGSTLVAFSDNGFLIMNGATVPEETKFVQITDQIAGVFYDSTYIGLVTGTGSTHQLLVYTTEGRRITDKSFEYSYTDMDYTSGEVTLYNNNSFCVYNLSGICKFDGSYTGSIADIFAVGRYRYGVVRDASIEQIQLG